jgi:hypothetical protein
MQEPQQNETGITPRPEHIPEMPVEVYVERRRSAGRAILGCGVIILIIAVIFFLLPTVLGINTLNNFFDGILTVLRPSPSFATTSSTQTIVTGIQPLGQLVTVSAQLAKADINIGVSGAGINACGFSADHVAQGAIESGVDLTRVTAEDITYNELTDTYTVHLPAPQLTSCRVDFIRQYSRSTTICNVDWDEARMLAQYVALTDFRDDAVEGGVIDQAELEARLVLSNFIGALTNSNVQIEFDEAVNQSLPSSCMPDVPDRWTFDEQNRTWTKQ